MPFIILFKKLDTEAKLRSAKLATTRQKAAQKALSHGCLLGSKHLHQLKQKRDAMQFPMLQ